MNFEVKWKVTSFNESFTQYNLQVYMGTLIISYQHHHFASLTDAKRFEW